MCCFSYSPPNTRCVIQISDFDNYKSLNSVQKSNEADGMDDFDRHDWKSETDRMADWEKDNLSVSPFQQKDDEHNTKFWH